VGLLIINWSTNESLFNIGPMPWGDGIVDIRDLMVLSEYVTYDGAPIVGDVNYDGVVDFLDHAELSKNRHQQEP
jgi:hypothetical protein